MRERDTEAYLRQRVKALGGLCVKLNPLSLAGVPDRVCLLPGARIFFAELKAPGKTPTELQGACHKVIRALGFTVVVIDSKRGVDAILQGTG